MWWAAAAIFVQALFGIAVVVDYRTQSAALVLVMYLLLKSAFVTNFGSGAELNQLVVNLGLIGGLLYLAAYGGQEMQKVRARRRAR